MNELDALVNINFQTRTIKENHTTLNIIRIGTSGSLQKDIPVNSFLLSTHALDINGMLRSYPTEHISHSDIENAFVAHTNWDPKKCFPLVIKNSKTLESKLVSNKVFKGMTATAGGFYGPQGRSLRLDNRVPDMNEFLKRFEHKNHKILNFEMETSALYGLSALLGHHSCTVCAVIGNRFTIN